MQIPFTDVRRALHGTLPQYARPAFPSVLRTDSESHPRVATRYPVVDVEDISSGRVRVALRVGAPNAHWPRPICRNIAPRYLPAFAPLGPTRVWHARQRRRAITSPREERGNCGKGSASAARR